MNKSVLTTDEFDIHGLSVTQAKEYIFQYVTSVNLDKQKAVELRETLQRWKKRVILAEQSGDMALATQAQNKASEIKSELEVLDSEIARMSSGIDRMKHNLTAIAAAERSIDPDLLEQELRILAGNDLSASESESTTTAATEKKIRAAETDAALAALKKQMGL